MVIYITEQAAKEIRQILSEQPSETSKYLRIGIKAGGCKGFTYILDLSVKPEATDDVSEIKGIKILCDPISSLYVEGMAIDFSDDRLNRGFIFNNPNAKEICPCGVSFGI
ncbi:MAG: iron-sulfur cluster assembly accessory protein [Phycisphaerae bacterium]